MHQVLVYSDSLSWGIVPTTRRRLPFDTRWPGVMEIAPLSLVILMLGTNNFQSMHPHTAWHAAQGIATELSCHYFDAGTVIAASPADGIHIDADEHRRLGHALAGFVAGLAEFTLPSER